MIRGAAEGELLQCKARVLLADSSHCLVRILTDLKGAHRDVQVPYTELARPESIDALFEVIRVAMHQSNRMRDILLRLQAEAYELGHYTGTGKTGFGELGLLPTGKLGQQ